MKLKVIRIDSLRASPPPAPSLSIPRMRRTTREIDTSKVVGCLTPDTFRDRLKAVFLEMRLFFPTAGLLSSENNLHNCNGEVYPCGKCHILGLSSHLVSEHNNIHNLLFQGKLDETRKMINILE